MKTYNGTEDAFNHPLFKELSPLKLQNLKKIIPPIEIVRKGEYLIKEGDLPDNIYIIESGSVEILKHEPITERSYRISVLSTGELLGELPLFHPETRMASVRALEDMSVLKIPIDALKKLPQSQDFVNQIKAYVAEDLVRRLFYLSETTAVSLKDNMEELVKRTELSKLTNRLLVGICLYMFALTLTTPLAKIVPDTAIISIPILACFAFGVYRTVATSPYPKSVYGYTLANWKKNCVEAIFFSIPIAIFIVVIKSVLVSYWLSYQGMLVFDLSKSTGLSNQMIILYIFAYAAFVPVQEMIRCGVQSAFQLTLISKYRKLESIFLANLLFSATHLHVSVNLALIVFPLGIFWGWLFARQHSLVGSSLSHILLGVFAFSIVGFDVL